MMGSFPDLRERVAGHVIGALGDAGLALGRAELDAHLRRVDLEGARLFEALVLDGAENAARERAAACFALGISISTIHRVTGFGAWQARVLGGPAAEEAGALFNLGIVLFDAMLDRGNVAARGEALDFGLETIGVPGVGPEAIFFRRIARRFFALAGNGAIMPMLQRLLEAERACARGSLEGRVLARAMRRKSVGPFLLLARLGGRGTGLARIFGRAVWIVDDLWDWEEDAGTGTPGRPALRSGPPDQVLAAELRCLAAAFAGARGWPVDARDCLAATIAGWVRMPRPQPLFAQTMAPA